MQIVAFCMDAIKRYYQNNWAVVKQVKSKILGKKKTTVNNNKYRKFLEREMNYQQFLSILKPNKNHVITCDYMLFQK